MLEIEKQKRQKKRKGKKPKNPIKIGFFKVVIQKYEKSKKKDFFAKIAWHYLCQEGRKKTRIFVHTICFGQKFFLDQNSVKLEKL